MAQITLAKALTAGLRKAMEENPKVLIMGEDVGKLGGVFASPTVCRRTWRGPGHRHPARRVRHHRHRRRPRHGGYRPVCEIQFDGFVYPAYDQIVSQVAKLRFRSMGRLPMPIVIRIPFGGGIGRSSTTRRARRRSSPHTGRPQGRRLLQPVDGYWMIQQAIAD
jgi:pyruvate dehydrogenase E1 component beta subunit